MLTYKLQERDGKPKLLVAFLDGTNPKNWGIVGYCEQASLPAPSNCFLHRTEFGNIWTFIYYVQPKNIDKVMNKVKLIGKEVPTSVSVFDVIYDRISSAS